MSDHTTATHEAPTRDLDGAVVCDVECTGPTGGTDADADTEEGTEAGTEAKAERGVFSWLTQVAGWLVILAVLLITMLMLVLPRLAGAEPYTILTGSMRTIYPPGTLVVSKPVDPSQVEIGDVITFQLVSGEPTVVTHRVIGVRRGPDGQPEFITKGDANPSPDLNPVRSVQLRGRLWYAVPYLGRVNTLLTGHERQLSVYGVAGLLTLYAGGMFLGAERDRRRRSGAGGPGDPTRPRSPGHRRANRG